LIVEKNIRNGAMRKRSLIKTDIGGFGFAISIPDKKLYEKIKPFYSGFLTSKRSDIRIEVRWGSFDAPPAKQISISRGIYGLGRQGRRMFFIMPGKILAHFDASFKNFHCILQEKEVTPFLYFQFFLLNNLVARVEGAVLHGCGVEIGEKGVLFMAPSGGGKTTIGRLFGSDSVVSDETIIVSRKNGGFIINPVPWWSKMYNFNHRDLALDKVFFLEKAAENAINPANKIDAVRKLSNDLILPLWFPDSIMSKRQFDFKVNLVKGVPCFDLRFKPTTEVVRFLKR